MYNMRIAILLLAVLLPAILANPFSEEADDGDRSSEGRRNQPNIIFILVSDLGNNDIGYNNPNVHTPVLDKLAKEGRKLTSNYAQIFGSPGRMGLLTGRYPWKDKSEQYGPTSAKCMPTNIPLLPEVLREAGYNTHLIGRWGLGHCQDKCLPTSRGFDTFYGMYLGSGDHYNHTDYGQYRMYDWHRGLVPDKTVLGQHSTKVITEEAVKILENHDTNAGPFFMLLSHTATHVPLQVDQMYINMYPDEPEERRKVFLGMVSELDDQTGILVDALDRLHLRDNTLIVFSGVNGAEGIIGFGDNTPFRGCKLSLYEGGYRVVGFVNGEMVTKQGTPKEGTSDDGLFSSLDWFPTLVNIGKGKTDGLQLDGVDQTKMILHGGKSQREEFVYWIDLGSFPRLGNSALRIGDFKLIWGYEGTTDGYGRACHFNNDPNWEIVPRPVSDPVLDITDPYRLYFTPQVLQIWLQGFAGAAMNPNDLDSGHVHLFYLPADPEERHDLATLPEYAERVLEMKKRIVTLSAEWKPPPRIPNRPAEAFAVMVDGTWTTGFCNDVDQRI